MFIKCLKLNCSIEIFLFVWIKCNLGFYFFVVCGFYWIGFEYVLLWENFVLIKVKKLIKKYKFDRILWLFCRWKV